jgi:hypothetical protein
MSAMRLVLERLRHEWRERWDWYRRQRREPRPRRWWDAYNT